MTSNPFPRSWRCWPGGRRPQPDERAYVFLSDRGEEEAALTFRELHEAAQALAARLTGIARPATARCWCFRPASNSWSPSSAA